MRSTYRVLAYIIAAEVVIQAMAIAFAVFGLTKWVDDGGTLDKAAIDSESLDFTGVIGFPIHGINGMMIIPLIALIFLIVSFFARVPGGVKWAGIVVLLVAVQITLGILGHDTPVLGALHGLNALAIFAMALVAARHAQGVGMDTSPASNRAGV